MNTENLKRLYCLLSKIMSNKQVLVCGMLESTNDLRRIFVGHIGFKKLMKFRRFIEILHCCMTSLRNTNLGVFIQCQYIRTILRNKNIGHSLFKKHPKFQYFDEIFYCGMTKLRNTSLCIFVQCQHKNHFNKRTYEADSV